jgi:acyl-CoA synthetase (AMP-forming)/AMP-acid ligase II
MSVPHARVSPTIAGELSAAAAQCPDDVAVYCGAERRTFGEYQRDVWAAARALIACGVRPGDRVGLWIANSLDGAVALLGVVVAGGTAVTLNTRYTDREITEILRRARCRVIIAVEEFLGRRYAAEAAEISGGVPVVCIGANAPDGTRSWARVLAAGAAGAHRRELARRIEAQRGDEIAVVQYTSGTTGQPKGVLLRQGPMLATSAAWSGIVGLSRGDVYPVTYSIAHVGGYKTGLLATLAARAATVLIPVISTETLVEAIAAHPPTVFNGPPPVLRSLLAALRDGQLPATTRIRTVVTGSAIVPPQLIRELARDLGVTDVINAFGITEASGVCMMTRRGDPVDLVCDTVGCAIPGVELRVAADEGAGNAGDAGPSGTAGAPGTARAGEIEVRGPNVMAGYLEDPQATAEAMHDGWLRTGDIGWIDAAGYVRIVGRAKDMVVVGGFNVFPAEVEHVLADYPGVAEAAVVGVPDERLGEVTVAFVVAAGDAPAPDAPIGPDALIGWCRDRLASFKVPRRVWLVDSLPRVTLGKVAKPELRDLAIARLAPAPGTGQRAVPNSNNPSI